MNFLKVITSLFPSLPIYDSIPFPFPSMFSSLFPFHSSPSFLPIYLLVTFFSRPFIPYPSTSLLPSFRVCPTVPFSSMFPLHLCPNCLPIQVCVPFPSRSCSPPIPVLIPSPFISSFSSLSIQFPLPTCPCYLFNSLRERVSSTPHMWLTYIPPNCTSIAQLFIE